MSIYDKGDFKIKIECTSEQFADIKARLVPIGTEADCIFRAWNEVPNCYGVNCNECFHTYIERVLSAEEQEQKRKHSGKPPLGLIPTAIWKEQRKRNINDAIGRYLADGLKIPPEWVEEYNQL